MKNFCKLLAALSFAGCPFVSVAQDYYTAECHEAEDTVSMVIIGDVMLHQSQIDNSRERFAKKNGKSDPGSHSDFDFSPYFHEIKDILQNADICVANMEFTLAGAPFSGYPAFGAPDSYAEYMAECGINVFLTANNHILDRNSEGMSRTIEIYRNLDETHGVLTTGSFEDDTAKRRGYPLLIECDGITLALVNFTYGTNVEPDGSFPMTNYMEKADIKAALERAKAKADLVIALPHWGIEYDLKHSPSQENSARWLAENGADIIVGSHPHVVQDAQTIITEDGKKVPVIYSLGNIISNMSAANTQIGLIVKLMMTRDSDGKAVILDPECTYTWCSLPGMLTDSHVTVPVKKFKDSRSIWLNPAEYDKMTATYSKILQSSGIKDK